MKGKLTRAAEAADERKSALAGETGPFVEFVDEAGTRKLLLGTDVDFEEFQEMSTRAGAFFARAAIGIPLLETCRAAWSDGILVGFLLGRMPED